MHLSQVKLWNFRRFGSSGDLDFDKPNLVLPLKKGLNVLVGENDSGKSGIIDAVRRVLGTHSLDWNPIVDDDFFRDAPRLRIEITVEDMTDEQASHFTEWIGWRKRADQLETYLRVNLDVRRTPERILPSEVRAGADNEGSPLSAYAREYLKCTYLKPLRDAQADLIPKRNSRISRIFQGHSAFKGMEDNHHLVALFAGFNNAIVNYFDGKGAAGEDLADDQGKQLKRDIDTFIEAFCSSETSTAIDVTEGSLKSVLERLILSIKDAMNPGLGTLNRLFMAAELVHLSKNYSQGLRLGLIEELEAHLHPQAQMQVVEQLQKEAEIQLILSTHSPNLTSKVKLDNLIVCNGGSAFPMGKDFTKLGGPDYQFLECFLDVTKSNLFFAKGVIMVEGWAEEILIPALAKKMKAGALIAKDLTESGIAVVNVGGTSFLRYSKIFQRRKEPPMRIPVAVICDVDVREYTKRPKHDLQGNVELDDNGKPAHEYIRLSAETISADKTAAMKDKIATFNSDTVNAFVAPHWTLEYSLLKSETLKDLFVDAFKRAHPGAGADIELELARKLINRGLDKTGIAYDLARELREDCERSIPKVQLRNDDTGIDYLVMAIKYACGY